ncbi:MAG: response regulator transcription factor [Candidatus Saccharibacteria bacterium]|nr:response regulator transcription factor [Candidatus Saccharibacteria bacterium]
MRLLLIEDERKLARALQRTLQNEGYAVDVEHSTTEGYAMAHTQPYDLLIIDRMLPGEFTDGVAMLAALRSNDIHTPALLLTALGEVQHKIDGLDAGADDYLAKPFATDELLARIRALLRRPHTQTTTVLSAGKLSLDTATRAVTFAGTPITLTVKEYALLQYLLRAEGRVVSKEQIMQHVWDFDADILPNTVEAYIKALRKKIDTKFKVTYIKTVRGVGYKLEA